MKDDMVSFKDSIDPLNIVMICDQNVVQPACVTLLSIKQTKIKNSLIAVYIVDMNLSDNERLLLTRFNDDKFVVRFMEKITSEHVRHVGASNSFASANSSALQKFFLADMLPDVSKILYLDCDLLVKNDLQDLYSYDLKDKLAGVIPDSGQLYYQSPITELVEKYFNSGVMLLNLDEMRKQNTLKDLIEFKKNVCTGNLVDQDAFNFVFNKKVLYLSVR